MARIEWPNAMTIPSAPTCFSQPVPPSQPRDSSLKCRSNGGSVAPRIQSVRPHQTTITTIITVVMPMIFHGLVARLLDAEDVLVPEVERDADGDHGRAGGRGDGTRDADH